MKVNTPEFANAWRVVSEGILELVQNKGIEVETLIDGIRTAGIIPGPKDKGDNECSLKGGIDKGDISILPPAYTSESTSEIDVILYSNTLMQKSDGYHFGTLTDNDKMAYKITIYKDKTCEFEANFNSELIKAAIDNKSRWVPEGVIELDATLTESGRIETIVKGKGIDKVSTVQITEPIKAKVIN